MRVAKVALLLLASFSRAAGSHVVSGTDARLPMSLSTVIQDLETEGASYVTTATFITSKSVRRTESATLLKRLFGISGSGDDLVEYGVTTAFGKKLADSPEAENDDSDGGSGVAIACPNCSRNEATASEVSSTVVACGGTIVYVADSVDLGRGEGLFDYLGPSIERLLAFRTMAESEDTDIPKHWKHRPSTLIVVFNGVSSEKELNQAKREWQNAASQMLKSIIQPTQSATKLDDVFDRIEYLSAIKTEDVDMMLCPAGGRVSAPGSPSSREPSEVASDVSDVVTAGLVENLGPMVEMASKVPVKHACPKLKNPLDLASARFLGPLANQALSECLASIHRETGADGKTLVPEFGALGAAAIKRALDNLDEASGSRFKASPIAKRIRDDLKENLYSEIGDLYDLQVASLKLASFDMFRSRLNKLRISPNLPDQMKEAADSCMKEFASAVKKLRVPRATSNGSWMTTADQISSLRTQMAEHNAERLKAARASGQFKPLPRKGVSVGFNWLLPKPFGNDYRQTPHLTHSADDLVYMPADGITDVSGDEIRSGDWRRGVVPVPSGSEMLYFK